MLKMDTPQYEEQIVKELEKSLLIDDKMEAYHSHVREGKASARQGDLASALKQFKLAYHLQPSAKLKARMQTITDLLEQQEEEEEDDDEFENVEGSGLQLFRSLHDKLYEHQREGVAFLYSLYRDGRKGGILADDMGLGKTIQVISFLSGMYDAELVKHTLLVMPTSLIANWTREFSAWTPGMRVKQFHGTSKVERNRNLAKVQRLGGVVITTYQMLINNWQLLAAYQGREFRWDYVILDEAHKIKTTSTKTAKSAYAIPARHRVLLTGTPVQNNLRELWALFDFACQGALLGTSKTFKAEYENPITRAREKDATPGEKALGLRMSEALVATITPYFLRRTKAEVQLRTQRRGQAQEQDGYRDEAVEGGERAGPGAVMPELTRKNDLIVWTFLSAVQEDIYRQFLSLEHIKELLMTTRSPLAELNILKKLCDHPRLLSAAVTQFGLHEHTPPPDAAPGTDPGIAHVPEDVLVSESGKMVFLLNLLETLQREGKRTLVFAHFRRVLDILQRVLEGRGFGVMRLDGTVAPLAERERRIALFQEDRRYSVFLLTTQVGGVGITLTAANRVVIYDPSWNPATDAQAVDRAYRIGQTEDVVIYRLITCGTVEEKIYRRQVFKDSLIRQTTGDKKNPFRYFSQQQLKELFTLEDPRSSSTQMQLQAMHAHQRHTDCHLDRHIAQLLAMGVFGISDHDLMFSQDAHGPEEDKDPEEEPEASVYIQGRVAKAQELVRAESALHAQLAEAVAESTEPAWLRPAARGSGKKRQRSPAPRPPLAPPPPPPPPSSPPSRSPVLVDLSSPGPLPFSPPQDHWASEDEDGSLHNEVIDLAAIEESVSEPQSVGSVSAGRSESGPSPVARELWALEGDSMSSQEPTEGLGSLTLTHNEVIDLAAMEESVSEPQSVGSVSAGRSESDPSPVARELWALEGDSMSSQEPTEGLGSLGGNFNLLLDESDNVQEQQEEEEEQEERKLLSQLQMEGSFSVDRSLAMSRESSLHCSRSPSPSHISESEASLEESLILTRRKKAVAVINTDDEEEGARQPPHVTPFPEASFHVQGASTPKSGSSGSNPKLARSFGSAPHPGRRSVGVNMSVASRHSLVVSLVEELDESSSEEEESKEDMEEQEPSEEEQEEEKDIVEDEEEHVEGEDEEKDVKDEEEHVEGEDEEEDVEDVEEDVEDEEEQEEEDEEELSGDPELASGEQMDQCAAGPKGGAAEACDSYEALVRRGRQRYGDGRLDEALACFLQAIDIAPGDPEVQLLTIQLYRKLSQVGGSGTAPPPS